jgi:hypothetical protein
MLSRDDEIREVRAEQGRRGKRRLTVLKKFREALQIDDIEKFKERRRLSATSSSSRVRASMSSR